MMANVKNGIFLTQGDTIHLGNSVTSHVSSENVGNSSGVNDFLKQLESQGTLSSYHELEGGFGFGTIGNFSANPETVGLALQLIEQNMPHLKLSMLNSLLKSNFSTIADAKKFAAQNTISASTSSALTSNLSKIKNPLIVSLIFAGLLVGLTSDSLDVADRLFDSEPSGIPAGSISPESSEKHSDTIKSSNGITPSASNSAGITPSASNSAGITPSASNSAGITPSASNSAGITPSASNSAGITPSASNSAGITPSASNLTEDGDPDAKGGGADPIVIGKWGYVELGQEFRCVGSPNPFDFDNDGFKEQMCYWYHPETKILFVDFNGNKILDNGHELLNSPGYSNGLEILTQSPELCVVTDCYLWQDKNSDILVNADEIEPFKKSFKISNLKEYPKGELVTDLDKIYPRENLKDNPRGFFIYGEAQDEILGDMYATKPTYWMKGVK